MRTTTKLSVLILSSAVLGGCASTSETQRIPPGHVALVAAHYAPESNFNAYARGRGANAARQAGQTAVKGARVAAVGPAVVTRGLGQVAPILGVLGMIVTVAAGAVGGVIGGAVGAIDGAANGMPSDQVQAIHQPINTARRNAEIQTMMAQRVLALSADLPNHQLSYLPELGPTSSWQLPDYQILKAAGFESVLELAVIRIGFEATQGEPPSAVFEMALRARAVPLTADARPSVWERTYRGTSRSVPEWQADDGRLFQEELDASYRSLAQFVSEEMFSSAVAVVRRAGPVATSSVLPLLPTAGDTWSYRLTNSRHGNRQSRIYKVIVTSVTPNGIFEQLSNEDSSIMQTEHRKGGFLIRQGNISLFSPYLIAFNSLDPSAAMSKIENLDPEICGVRACSVTGRVVGPEVVRVPAGEFQAIKVEIEQGWIGRGMEVGGRTLTIWYSLETKRAVKFSSRGSQSRYIESEFDLELESYKLN